MSQPSRLPRQEERVSPERLRPVEAVSHPGSRTLLRQLGGLGWPSLASGGVALAILALTIAVVAWRVQVQLVRGPGWDTFAFLGNAMEFAGQSIGYSELHRPPMLSFLTSLIFRLGYVHENVIIALDGWLLFAGVVGLFLLLRLRFGTVPSAVGALFFLSFPVVMKWAATGYSDLASISFSIWAIYLAILAARGRPILWALAVPLTAAALLTRFTGLLLIFPVFLALVFRERIFRRAGPLALGVAAAIVMYLPFALIYMRKLGEPLFPFSLALGVAEGTEAAKEIGQYEPSLTWYLERLSGFIVPGSYQDLAAPLLALSTIGLILYLRGMLRGMTRRQYVVLAVAFAVYLLVFFKAGLIVRQVGIAGFLGTVYWILREEQRDRYWMDLVIFSWFLVYFDAHSHQPVKDERYFLVMAPPLVYLALAGFAGIAEAGRRALAGKLVWAGAALLMAAAAAVSLADIYGEIEAKRPGLHTDVIKASNWLTAYDPAIKTKKVYSDDWVGVSWYMKQNVEPMPSFKRAEAMNNELVKYGVDYYVALGPRPVPSYDILAKVGQVFIYEEDRKNAAAATKPRMLYLGKNWQNYLEDVLSFRYQLIYGGGKYGKGESIYLDAFTAEELGEYPIVLAYNFRWHNREAAEKLLREYVENGGRLVIDGSGTWNMAHVAYVLDNHSLLGVATEQRMARRTPEIALSPAFDTSSEAFSPFISEGRPWFGMTYHFPDAGRVAVLAELDDTPLIALQEIGKGKVLWIGYNFVFHAFDSGNKQERKVIRKAFDMLSD